MLYIQIDTEGFPTAFYDNRLISEIPNDAINITPEQYTELVDNSGLRRWENGEVVEHTPSPPTPEEIRAAMPSLTARQLRLGLVGGGIALSSVEGAIAAIPDEQAKAVAEIEWQFSSQFERDHPLIEQVGAVLGLTVEQIDAMWQAAMEI